MISVKICPKQLSVFEVNFRFCLLIKTLNGFGFKFLECGENGVLGHRVAHLADQDIKFEGDIAILPLQEMVVNPVKEKRKMKDLVD